MSELDDAIAEYIVAREAAEAEYQRVREEYPSKAFDAWKAIEQPAWEKFFPIKQKYWELEHS